MISKKELLKEMDISYGQLYRWKREGLIPDEWFIKQSVSTGQETFFEREKIVPRISKILELKEQYPFEELKKFLNPNLNERTFSVKEAVQVDEIDPYILKMYVKERKEINIYDMIIIYLFSKFQNELNFNEYISVDFSNIKSMLNIFYLLKSDSKHYVIIATSDAIIDQHLKIVEQIPFEEISSQIAQNLI